MASDLDRYRPLVRFLGGVQRVMGIVAVGVDLAGGYAGVVVCGRGASGDRRRGSAILSGRTERCSTDERVGTKYPRQESNL
jgi:hypothetical protein